MNSYISRAKIAKNKIERIKLKGGYDLSRKGIIIDTKKLSKKYKTDVNKIIKGWKRNKNDLEISADLNVDLLKIFQLREDLEEAYLLERSNRYR